MKTRYNVIVNVDLEYSFKVDSENDALIEAENVELPKQYVIDSFEIVKVIKSALKIKE